jgi:hypothetical protein
MVPQLQPRDKELQKLDVRVGGGWFGRSTHNAGSGRYLPVGHLLGIARTRRSGHPAGAIPSGLGVSRQRAEPERERHFKGGRIAIPDGESFKPGRFRRRSGS